MATNTQPIGTPVDPNERENKGHGVTPSGPKGDNPATAGPGETRVRSNTPENADGELNASPEDVNATPGTTPEK